MVLNIWVKYMKKNANKLEKIITILLFIIIIIVGIYFNYEKGNKTENIVNNKISYEISNILEYKGEDYVEINNNIPKFTTEDMNLEEDYNVYVYNVQDGIVIDYATGKSRLAK